MHTRFALVSKQQVRGASDVVPQPEPSQSDQESHSQTAVRVRFEQSGYQPTDRRRGSGRKQDPRVPVGWVAAGKTSRGGPRIGFPAWRSPAGLFRLAHPAV